MLLVSFQVSFQVRSFARIPFSPHLCSLGAWLCFSFDYLGPIVIPSNRIIPGTYIIPLLLYVRARHLGSFHPRAVRSGKFHPFPIWTAAGTFYDLQGVFGPLALSIFPFMLWDGLCDV
jgi:hypothetical protein